jgi:hypothetical protein
MIRSMLTMQSINTLIHWTYSTMKCPVTFLSLYHTFLGGHNFNNKQEKINRKDQTSLDIRTLCHRVFELFLMNLKIYCKDTIVCFLKSGKGEYGREQWKHCSSVIIADSVSLESVILLVSLQLTIRIIKYKPVLHFCVCEFLCQILSCTYLIYTLLLDPHEDCIVSNFSENFLHYIVKMSYTLSIVCNNGYM